ncbi:flagellar biosynthesis protein FlhF [Variovorax sp. YR216]|uniref:flagellar biosynthesis protein FlhF n=1 Tax=Variovorax sp. YR216 TaxID=1882828 RepID=UPI00089BDE31|nr:flagellar biosynthesis protein FlhF [Variovorax sp. YR216]SEA42933.1 flagellar biosynthesis protein FlhF [Variovorax sp. YR216]
MSIPTDVRTTARRFFAATSREALRLVREALGAEAIVLSNRASAEGVEIVAMLESDVTQALQSAAPMEPVSAPAPVVPARVVAPAVAAEPPAPVAPVAAAIPAPAPVVAAPAAQARPEPQPAAAQTDVVLSELHSMRGMIEEQLASVVWNDKQRQDPVRGRLLRTLLGAGFSARLSKALLEKLPTGQTYAQGMAFARSELIRALPVHEDEDALLSQGGVYALMGPTGVGKTTTTAKLAARCVMRFGADKLALVTTDSYRIGAYEQLRIYGQILDVPVYGVKDAADLHLVLQDLRDKHMVLIDTVGMSQRDRAVSDQIAMLCSTHRPVKRLLLLNATSHGDTLNEVVHAYRHGGGNELAGCIFTKMDESTHPGALIDTVIRHRLPVHYISSGQKVPENLMPADRAQLVDSVFQPRRHNALFVPSEVEMQDEPAGTAPSAQVVQAQAETDRLRTQYQNLIRAMAHDAQELATAAGALAGAQIGFEAARRFWRHAGDEGISQKAVQDDLMVHARSEIAVGCDSHVLALSGQVSLRSNAGDDVYECQSSLLLSDRSGQPLSAPNQWLSTAATRGSDARRKPGARQVQWLRQQVLGKPVVHLLPRLPAVELMAEWQSQNQQWLARVPGSTSVIELRTGESSALARIDAEFSEPVPTVFKGKPAMQCEAHAMVQLRVSADKPALPPLRGVVRRVLDERGQKILAQTCLLSNVDMRVTARQLAQWQAWAADAEPCFRLIRQGLQLAGGMGELGDPDMLKRLLIAGQVTTTAWRLLHARGEWADRARVLLNELTGRPAKSTRPLTGNALYLGVSKLFVLLEALGTESTAPMQPQLRAMEKQA